MATRTWLPTVLLQLLAAAFLGYRLYTMGLLNAQQLLQNLGISGMPPCGYLNVTEFALTSERVVLPEGVAPAIVHVKGGRIAAVHTRGIDNSYSPEAQQLLRRVRVLEYRQAVVSPGLIDVHTHLNEPGREDWEGVTSGTQAAAAGGITTLVDMPLNSFPCTTTAKLLREKLAVAKRKAHVDVAFYGGLVPQNARDISVLEGLLQAGAVGFKAFMHPSGINDFPHVEASHIAAALPVMKAAGVPLLLHATDAAFAVVPKGDPTLYDAWLESQPPEMESSAIRTVLQLLREDNASSWSPGFKIGIVHLSDATMLDELRQAKAVGLPLSVETCAHYLRFSSEGIAPRDTRFKCAPPLRDAANRELLWAGLKSGVLDMVSSDHSPAPPDLKRFDEGDFMKAWGGIAGLQYVLPATWTGARERGHLPEQMAQWWSAAPAALVGMDAYKGRIAAGYNADFAVWQPDEAADTSRRGLYHKHKATPYEGERMMGRVVATYVRGSLVFDDVNGPSPDVCGGPVLGARGGGRPRASGPPLAAAAAVDASGEL